MTCKVCSRNMYPNVNPSVTCGICGMNFHVKCTNLSKFDHRSMNSTDRGNWMCSDCLDLFPFNNISDNRTLIKYTTNTWCIKLPINCDDLLFDPFDFLSDSNPDVLDDYDPDINYYAECPQQYANSEYYDIEQFNDAERHLDDLSLFHCNIRSAAHNSRAMCDYLTALKHKFDVLCFSETWLHKNNDDIADFPNYSKVHKYRENKGGGGVSILVRDSIHYRELEDLTLCTDILECIFVELSVSKSKIIVGCVYRPPSSNLKMFNTELSEVLSSLDKSKDVYIMGDYNIDLLRSKSHTDTSIFINQMLASSYIPLINKPTRVTESTATIIDNIFTNSNEWSNTFRGILPTDVSDHFSIFCIISGQPNKTKANESFHTRIVNDRTLTELKNKLKETEWEHVLNQNDTNKSYDAFIETFQTAFKAAVPIKEIKGINKS